VFSGALVGSAQAVATVTVPIIALLGSGANSSAYQGSLIFGALALLFGAVSGAISGGLIATIAAAVFTPFWRARLLVLGSVLAAVSGIILAGLVTLLLVRIVNVDLNPWPYVIASALAAFAGVAVGLWLHRRPAAQRA